MRVLINNNSYTLVDINKFGGEGDLYTTEYMGETKCVKIYHPSKRTAYNEKKIYTLINRFKSISLGGLERHMGYPEMPVYDYDTRKFCGFMMKYFGNHFLISDLKFSSNHFNYGSTGLSDKQIINLCDELFFFVKVLHKAGIIVGDINPENIMIERQSLTPSIVDFDSVQIGTFYGNSNRQEYIDPSVNVDGRGKYKYFIYTIDSDIYALATIMYELLIGPKPHFFSTTVPTDTLFKKMIDLSFLDYYTNNNSKTAKNSLDLLESKESRAFKARLDYIHEHYPSVLNYLKSVFSEGKRFYFFYKQNRPVIIRKTDGVIEFSELELITQSKDDPEELDLFLEQFKIKLP